MLPEVAWQVGKQIPPKHPVKEYDVSDAYKQPHNNQTHSRSPCPKDYAQDLFGFLLRITSLGRDLNIFLVIKFNF